MTDTRIDRRRFLWTTTVGLAVTAGVAACSRKESAVTVRQQTLSTPPPPGHTGLHHLALLLPDRDALAAIVDRLLEHDYPIDDAQDHGGSIAVYLHDPDGNGIELSYDLPRDRWFDAGGNPVVKAEPFDPRKLLAAKGA